MACARGAAGQTEANEEGLLQVKCDQSRDAELAIGKLIYVHVKHEERNLNPFPNRDSSIRQKSHASLHCHNAGTTM